jgi:ABC-type Fe3+/spermidine/putrescine transport system ATPase subunit
VTHDQEEALTMSDRLAVMNDGRIEQIGPPREVYDEPANAYVADFLGVSNLLDASVEPGSNGTAFVTMGDFRLRATAGATGASGDAKVTIRPERIRVSPRFGDAGRPSDANATAGSAAADDGQDNTMPGMVERLVFTGSSTQIIVRLAPGGVIQALLQNEGDDLPFEQGTPVTVALPPDALRILASS